MFFWVSGKTSISTETTVFSFQLHIQKPRFRQSSPRFFKRFLRRWSRVKFLTDGKTLPVGQQQQNEFLLRRDACLTFPLKLYDTTLVIFHVHLTPHALLTVLEYPVPLVGPRMTHSCTAKHFLQHLKFSVKALPSLKRNTHAAQLTSSFRRIAELNAAPQHVDRIWYRKHSATVRQTSEPSTSSNLHGIDVPITRA